MDGKATGSEVRWILKGAFDTAGVFKPFLQYTKGLFSVLCSAFPSVSLENGTESAQGWPTGTGWALITRGSSTVPGLLLAQADPCTHAHVLELIRGEGLSICAASNTTCEHEPCLQEAAGLSRVLLVASQEQPALMN